MLQRQNPDSATNTEPGLVRSYSSQVQPTGLETFSGLQWLWLEKRPMPGSLLSSASHTLAHFKTFRVANIPSSLAFSMCITVGVGINDSDVGADLVTLSQSYAAFHHIGKMYSKPPCFPPWSRNCMKIVTCMYSQKDDLTWSKK